MLVILNVLVRVEHWGYSFSFFKAHYNYDTILKFIITNKLLV